MNKGAANRVEDHKVEENRVEDHKVEENRVVVNKATEPTHPVRVMANLVQRAVLRPTAIAPNAIQAEIRATVPAIPKETATATETVVTATVRVRVVQVSAADLREMCKSS